MPSKLVSPKSKTLDLNAMNKILKKEKNIGVYLQVHIIASTIKRIAYYCKHNQTYNISLQTQSIV